MDHPLHRHIGNLLESIIKGFPGTRVIKDPACSTEAERNQWQHLPLFCSEQKARKTKYCDVDLLVLKEGKIRFIFEIEESDIKPTQICGKFLTSALSKFYIHENENEKMEMANEVAFIQILDSSRLKSRNAKLEQFKLLEKSIRELFPLKNSRINLYRIFPGSAGDKFDELTSFIQKELKK